MRHSLLLVTLCLGCSGAYRTVVLDHPPIDAWSPAPAPGARICAVRAGWVGGAVPLLVYDERRLVAALGADSYVCWLAAAGVHRLTVRQYSPHVHRAPVAAAAELYPGARAYLAVSTDLDQTVETEWLDEKSGLEAIERCSWEELVAAPADERLR